MKSKKITVHFTLTERMGRVPVSTKCGGYMTPKKGKGSYNRKLNKTVEG